MHRIFLGMAITDGTLLVVSFLLGLLSPGAGPGIARTWHDLHFLVALFATMTTLLVHSIAFTYFLGTGKWVAEVLRVYGLPEWLGVQAVRNKRRAFPFELWGMLLIGAAAWLGAAADTRAGFNPVWHLAAAALALAFNLGAFGAEYLAIVAQARLLLEVKAQADRLREAQLAARAAEPA